MNETAFVFVPGGFCPGALFEKVEERLTAKGVLARSVDLATVVPSPEGHTVATMYDDAARVRDAAKEYIKQGKKVVLVGNSYGGFVITEAAKDLPTAHLVYLCSLLPPIGITCGDLVREFTPASMDSDSDFIDPPPHEVRGPVLFASLPQSEQEHYAGMLRYQSVNAFDKPLTYAGWEHIPTTMIIASNDKAVPPPISHRNVDEIIARGFKNVKKVTLDADHCAMLSNPDEIIDILLGIAA